MPNKNTLATVFVCTVSAIFLTGFWSTTKSSLSEGETGHVAFESRSGVTLYGDVTIPEAGDGPFPAMVLMHGTGGRGYRQNSWAEFFAENGIASINVDYFTGRGYDKRGSPPGDYYDVADAMKLIATHPKVDKNRIGVMGWSNGAEVALESALIDESKADGLTLKAHVVFYPPCELTSVPSFGPNYPIAVFLGTNDYVAKVWQCEEMVNKGVQSGGKDVRLIVYEGAYHGWDGRKNIDQLDHRNRRVRLVPDTEVTAQSRKDVMTFLRNTPILGDPGKKPQASAGKRKGKPDGCVDPTFASLFPDLCS
ncbi:MAG: dienelactone hydrolase family protein [Rhodospirillales bacterium]|nr:dienelactone hydrolase family protein [Rhodospirillales bacterium]